VKGSGKTREPGDLTEIGRRSPKIEVSHMLGTKWTRRPCNVGKAEQAQGRWPPVAYQATRGRLRLHVYAEDDLGLHLRDAFDRADVFTEAT